jgi:hypothetical protein
MRVRFGIDFRSDPRKKTMRIYKTTHLNKEAQPVSSFQASQTEASKTRAELKRGGHKPETQTVDIPTAKGPLIEWLNEHAV